MISTGLHLTMYSYSMLFVFPDACYHYAMQLGAIP